MPRRLVYAGTLAVLMSAVLLTLMARARETSPTKESANNPKPSAASKVQVSDVIIQGNQRMTTEQIKVRLRTRPGKKYHAEMMDEDVRQLYRTGQFSNIKTLVQEDGAGKVKIIFLLRDLPSVVQKVIFRGAKHIKEEELRNITGVRLGQPLNPNLNQQGCQKILERYEEQGRCFSYCSLAKGNELVDTEVIYEITEGPKVKVADIQFTGNTFVSSARLAAKMHLSSRWFHLVGGTYNKRMAESDHNEVIEYFRSHGFDDVKVALETQRSSDGREVTMIFHIQEGQRYRAEIGEQSIRPDHCSSGNILTVNRGQTYLGAVPEARQVQPKGDAHMPAKATAALPEKKGQEQPLARVGQIFIIGNDTVSDTSILAHVPLFPGSILKYADLKEAEKNLAKLDVFVVDPSKGVQPTIAILDVGDSVYKDIRITVKEKPQAKDATNKP